MPALTDAADHIDDPNERSIQGAAAERRFDDVTRLAVLREHNILDTPPEEQFDDLVLLAAQICETPIAAISLVDEHRQWFKAITGLNVTEYPRDGAFCAHTILQTDLMVVTDAWVDSRFADSPLVIGDPNIRFYAGMPLVTKGGQALGTLCVIDRVPRTLTPFQASTLKILAGQATHHLESALRRADMERLVWEKERLASIIEHSTDAIYSAKLDKTITSWNAGAEHLYGYAAAEMIGKSVDLILPTDRRDEVQNILAAIKRGETVSPVESVRVTQAGGRVYVSLQLSPVRDEGRNVVGVSVIARDVTGRKLAEAALREREAGISALIDSMPVILYATDERGMVTLSEGAGLSALGLRPGEAVGRSVFEFTVNNARNGENAQRALAGESLSYDTRLGRLDLHTELRPIRGDDGSLHGLIGVCVNVTERKRGEAMLIESRRRLALTAEAAGIGFWDWDMETGHLVWDAQMYALYGVREQDFGSPSEAWQNGIHPEDRNKADAEIARFLDGSGAFSTDFRVIWPSGEVRYIEAEANVQRGADGSLLRMGGVNRDVTARRLAEIERKRSEERFRVLFQQSSDAHAILGEEGIIDCNLAAVRILRCTDKAQVLSLHPAALSPEFQPDGRRSLEKKVEMDALAYERGQQRFEWIHRTIDGEDFPVEVTLTPVTLEGKPVLLVVWHDLTERKKAEEQIKAHSALLEQQKGELEQSRDEARAAQNEAQAATRAKSAFLAAMSHEIRTPMNGVIGMADLLLHTNLTDEQRDYVQTVTASGDALLTVLNDILDYSKIEAGRLDLEQAPFDLRRTLEDMQALLYDGAQKKGISLNVEAGSDLPPVLIGDAGRLRQVLTNLVGNGLKFTDCGGVTVRARMAEVDDGDADAREAVVRIEVSDTGIGIPSEALGRLFQSFSQVDATTTRRFGGTGLGLAISRQLVELMGGSIGVESVVGEGSTFWFTVRFGKQADALKYSDDGALAELTGVRVLVVDDSGTNLRILSGQLSGLGLLPTCALDGLQALELLRRTAAEGAPFGLAILDHRMPGMDGVELATRIKADPITAPVRLIMLSSATEREDCEAATTAGVGACLRRPVRSGALVDAVTSVMGISAGSSDAHSANQHDHVASNSDRARPRILVAEDNAVNQMVAVAFLKRFGCDADVAQNGREALDALSLAPYDLVLMDCHMPEMDGLKATREIRLMEQAAGHGRHLPVVALTAGAMAEERAACMEAGMDDFLAKPVRPDGLLAILSKFLEI